MRDLTKEEIDSAPEWCWLYAISGDRLYYSDGKSCTQGERMGTYPDKFKIHNPIPRKEFDISECKFNGEIGIEQSDELSITFTEYEQAVTLGRNEIVAAAKHFKLTASDLNTQ